MLFFSACTYIEYSGQNYDKTHSNRTAIEIIKPSTLNAKETFSTIADVCMQTGTDIYYEEIEGALTGRLKYIIYKTNVSSDFFDIKVEGKENTLLRKGECLTTAIPNRNNQYQIIGSTLLYDMEIYSLEDIDYNEFRSGTFYTNDTHARIITEELKNIGITATIIQDINSNQVIPQWLTNQGILLVLLAICMLFYFFSNKREFVIKKLSGYSDLNIFVEEIKKVLLLTSIVLGSIIVILVALLLGFNRISLTDCLAFFVMRFLLIAIVVFIITAVTGLYIFTQSRAEDIKGKTKYREVSIISFISKCIIILFCVINLTSSLFYIQEYNRLCTTVNNSDEMLLDKYYLPFSAASVDIDGNIENYMKYSGELVNDIVDTFGEENVIIVDSSEYDGMNENFSSFVLVNKTYLSFNKLKDEGGEYFNTNQLDVETDHIFVPMENKKVDFDMLYEFINQLDELCSKVEIHYYNSQPLYTFRPESGDQNGYIYNAILYLPNKDNLKEYALGLMSSCSLILNDQTQNPYERLYPLLLENKMENIIVETVEIMDYYQNNLTMMRISVLQSTFMVVLLLIVYIVAISFYASTYFQNNRKDIAIKLVSGYGITTFKSYLIQSVLLLCITLFFAKLFSASLVFILLCILFDITIFSFASVRWSKKHLSNILKGES